MGCKQCDSKSASSELEISPAINVLHVAALTQQAQAALVQKQPKLQSAMAAATAASTAPPGVATHVQVTSAGDVLVVTSSSQGNDGDVVLRGTLFGLPCELHINVSINNTRVTVKLELVKPFPFGPLQWEFDLTGVTGSGAGITGATGIVPAPGSNPLAAMSTPGMATAQGIGWVWCAIKCGGAQIMGTLLVCLPALASGPQSYIACVVAKLGLSDAAAIAKCVAEKCH